MDRKRTASLLLLVAVLATMSLAGFLTFGYSKPAPSTVEEALNIPRTPLQQRLYPVDSTIDSAVEVASPHMRYITYKDRSTEDVLLMPGSNTDMISSQWYYAEQPGENGRRPYIARVYGVGNVVIEEKVQQLNGLLLKTTVVSQTTKVRLITDFAADGVTHLREQEFLKPKCCGDEDLIRDERWRDDAGHTLAYRNIYHPDETRTITEFDEHMHVLKMIEWPKYKSVAGSSVKVYYPGSFKLRLESSADYYQNTVRYYRENDGSLEAIVKLSPGMTDIEYYDASGTKVRLHQSWWRTEVTADGVVTSTYRPYVIDEYDAQGIQILQQTFSEGVVSEEQRFNVTIDGVTFFRLDYGYAKDGTLKELRYWLKEVKYPPFKLETHTPAEGLKLTPLSAESLRMQIDIDPDLPIPPPQRGGY